MRHLIFLAPVILGACSMSVANLEVTSATPASVTVWGKNGYWGESGATEQEMTELASAYCAKHGRVARRIYEESYELGRTITFDCVAAD